MDHFEKYVKSHRDEFDYQEPSSRVWDNIQKEFKPKKKIKISTYIIRVAAVVVLLVVSAALISRFRSSKNSFVKNPELLELFETENFYAHQVDGKMQEIEKCYAINPDIREEVENDLVELEEIYKDLKNDLKDNISNKAVIEAMIENNRYRLKLVESVLEQINC